MTRRVRRRGDSQSKGKEKVIVLPSHPENIEQREIPRPDDDAGGEGDGGAGAGDGAREVVEAVADVDWTTLSDDAAIQLLSCLNYRDRASLASTCRAWRSLASASYLWTSLDLRPHRCDVDMAAALAGRCADLRVLRFRGSETAAAVMFLQARGLREIVGEHCRDVSDATLAAIAARHEALESLTIGQSLERVTSDGVRHVAMCCTRLRRLRLLGVREVGGEAINAFAKHCLVLEELVLMDCGMVDEGAIGNVSSLRFLSVAGSKKLRWGIASFSWSNLGNLLAVDVSRTDVTPSFVSRLLAQTKSLRVLSAFNCPAVEEEISHNPLAFSGTKGKLLLTLFHDFCKGISSLFAVPVVKELEIFDEWKSWSNKDINLNGIMSWLEWIFSHSLLRIAETVPHGMTEFWIYKGAALFLGLTRSLQEDVQERAATGLATFVVVDDENATVDPLMAETVMRYGGIPLLLELARSPQEGIQSEAAKAIANLSVNSRVAKTVADEGGINILADLARSMNRFVAEEAAGGLWNLSVGEEHKAAIAKAGAVKALVDLIFKWPSGTDGVLERAAGALANLAADDNCSMEIAKSGGVRALVMLARSCKIEGVQEQAARALANLAAHGDSNSNNAAVGKEAGALEALVQLTSSQNESVRQEAAGALWNLSFDDRNREAIAAAGGVQALVALAQACINASHGLQERAAGALWGLSVSETNSIAIGQEGGVAPLIALARSDAEDVHETAAGALWNLAFNADNALSIVEEGGVPALVHLCSSSNSKMARFMAALALAYMFDGRMDECALAGTSSEGTSKNINFDGARRMALKHIEAFVLSFSDPQVFSTAAASSATAALLQVADAARIQEAGHLRCSIAEIGRFVSMLRNPSSILRACAAFALLQFTIPGGGHALHHAGLLKKAGAARVLRAAAAAATAPIEAKIFAKIVLRNLEHHHQEASL